MTSLDSNCQSSDSRPSTPSTKRSSENLSEQKWGEHDIVSSPDPDQVKFKKYKTENK